MFPSLHNPFSKKVKSVEEIVLKKKIECLVLLGDNILDNSCGLDDPTKHIEYQIIDTLHRTLHSKNKGKSPRKESTDKEQEQNKENESKHDDNYLHPNANHQNSNLLHIHNLSLHGLDTHGLLHGMAPDPQHIALRKKYNLSPYPMDYESKTESAVNDVDDDEQNENDKDKQSEHMMHPLESLSAMVASSEIKVPAKLKDKHHINSTVVLSVGLLDLVRNLKYGKPELIIEALRKESFPENIEKVVDRIINGLALNLILVWSTFCLTASRILKSFQHILALNVMMDKVIPFEPHETLTRNKLHFARDDLLNVMEFVATKLMQIAEKFKVPVIDLSRTLNPFKAEHYGKHGMEPSMESGQFIVDLIFKILSVWEWNDEERKSLVFYGTKEDHDIQSVDNDKAYRSSYFNVVQSRAMLNEATMNETEMDLLADLFGGD